MCLKNKKIALFISLTIGNSPIILANDIIKHLSETTKITGFGTLGLTHNDNSDAGAVFAFTQKNQAKEGFSLNLDSVLGLQLEWKPLDGTSIVAQTVGRAGQSMKPELRMAYLRQQITDEIALRGGRIRSPLFFDSDVSEIGYAYMMSRPPIGLYNIASSVMHIDGLDIQWQHTAFDVPFMLQGYYGYSDYIQRIYNINPIDGSKVGNANVEFNNIYGVAINILLPNTTLKATQTFIEKSTLQSSQVNAMNAGINQLSNGLRAIARSPFMPNLMQGNLLNQADQLNQYVNAFDSRPIYTSIGFDSYLGDWRLLGEYVRFDSQSAIIGVYNGFHITAGYSWNEFTPYVSFANLERQGKSFNAYQIQPTGLNPLLDNGLMQLKSGLNQSAQFANLSSRSITVGIRWDFLENMDMKLQYDYVETPSSTISGNFAANKLPMDNQMDLVTLSVDFVF